ncbi:AaceriACR137Wp [[Ashbya] aceris (nom. inval.)]|nr:AaceriACR137Wp [[Ashbya] aceris (nom. inval.)]
MSDYSDDIYVRARLRNQFGYMTWIPEYIEDRISSKKGILQRYQDYQQRQTKTQEVKVDSLVKYEGAKDTPHNLLRIYQGEAEMSALARYEEVVSQQPQWHAPWKLTRVINGHTGWVRCVSVDPVDNAWFATGSNDSTIRVWDLATGRLKVTLQGHIMTVRDICISARHPYMFSASQDKLVKCWDLERNTVVRDFHGTLSGVHSVDLHPSLDLIVSAGRDSVVRVWDIRSRSCVLTLAGHRGPINKVRCLPVDPQIVSCSTDATVKLWDIVAGKPMKTLTHHKRNVRDIAFNPTEFSFASACTDDIRSWKLSDGQLLTNFNSESLGIVNTLSCNQDGVLFAGGDTGELSFFDYKTGHKFQQLETTAMPGSLESEKGVLASTFDRTGLRLLTCERDKSIKIWKHVDGASQDSHPGLPWNPSLVRQRF